MSLEQEIIDALWELGPEGATGYQITTHIESRSPSTPWRFLWWHGESRRIIGFGTMYRALDKLVERGVLTRTRHDDSYPPRFVYQLPQRAATSEVERFRRKGPAR